MKRKDRNTQSPSPAERLPSLDRSSRVLSYSSKRTTSDLDRSCLNDTQSAENDWIGADIVTTLFHIKQNDTGLEKQVE